MAGFFFDFEAVRTRCSAQVRTAPFVVRAPSPREFEDWLRALRWCLARLRRGSVEEEPSSEGVSRDFYLSGGSAAAGLSVASSAAGVTPETHKACARGVREPIDACRERAPSRGREAVAAMAWRWSRHAIEQTQHATHTQHTQVHHNKAGGELQGRARGGPG